MKIRDVPFNIYLSVGLAALVVACHTPEERQRAKEAASLRLFLETHGDASSGVPIYRQNPIRIPVEREPFLTEVDLVAASVIELPGGFGIRAQFDGHGALVLEGVTVAHKGRHIAIQSDFGETRWLAAPLITRRISNGELVFTPDATLAESERIVRGLSNVVAKIKRRSSGF